MISHPDQLREQVRRAYSAAAAAPCARHPFPVGRDFAASLGYPLALLDQLPASCSEAFAGVSNVAVSAPIPPGATVADIGCGAGLDTLIAAMRVGSHGRVLGLDFSRDMLHRARAAARLLPSLPVAFLQASAEALPLPAASLDFVLINGLFNLNPYRHRIFAELARVLKPASRVFASELVLAEPLPPALRSGEANWFS
jgi:SAM-dependent methyltransferase